MIALFFDTETTGFKSSTFTPEIVQIGAILQDTETRRVLAELNLIIQPDNPIPEKVSAIHGITDELAKQVGMSTELAEVVFSGLVDRADILVAHNISFDLGIIDGFWNTAQSSMDKKRQFCTMKQATEIVGIRGTHVNGYKYPKLTEAYRHFFNEDFDNAHDAMADVRACRDVFFALERELS